MRVLLDTHALLWWLTDVNRLSAKAREAIADPGNELFWSVVSSWEVAIKAGLGRIRLAIPLRTLIPQALREESISTLMIEQSHAFRVAELPPHHREPFDRMLIAQSELENLPLLSADPQLRTYDIEVIW